MSNKKQPRILDVGQCDFDHGNITRMLTDTFGAQVDRTHSIEETLETVKRDEYDLILVNRIFDADASEGIELIRQVNELIENKTTSVMLVSNFEDAQERAVELGAAPGFGKSSLDDDSTIERLTSALGC